MYCYQLEITIGKSRWRLYLPCPSQVFIIFLDFRIHSHYKKCKWHLPFSSKVGKHHISKAWLLRTQIISSLKLISCILWISCLFRISCNSSVCWIFWMCCIFWIRYRWITRIMMSTISQAVFLYFWLRLSFSHKAYSRPWTSLFLFLMFFFTAGKVITISLLCVAWKEWWKGCCQPIYFRCFQYTLRWEKFQLNHFLPALWGGNFFTKVLETFMHRI